MRSPHHTPSTHLVIFRPSCHLRRCRRSRKHSAAPALHACQNARLHAGLRPGGRWVLSHQARRCRHRRRTRRQAKRGCWLRPHDHRRSAAAGCCPLLRGGALAGHSLLSVAVIRGAAGGAGAGTPAGQACAPAAAGSRAQAGPLGSRAVHSWVAAVGGLRVKVKG